MKISLQKSPGWPGMEIVFQNHNAEVFGKDLRANAHFVCKGSEEIKNGATIAP